MRTTPVEFFRFERIKILTGFKFSGMLACGKYTMTKRLRNMAGADTLAARCETEYRKSRKKLADADKLRNALKTNLSDPLIYDHPNKLTIESDNLGRDETFALIQQHLKKFD